MWLKIRQKSWGVRRIAQAGNATLRNPTGALYIVTLRASATATVEGNPVKVGQSTFLRQMVAVRPEFDCLLIVP